MCLGCYPTNLSRLSQKTSICVNRAESKVDLFGLCVAIIEVKDGYYIISNKLEISSSSIIFPHIVNYYINGQRSGVFGLFTSDYVNKIEVIFTCYDINPFEKCVSFGSVSAIVIEIDN